MKDIHVPTILAVLLISANIPVPSRAATRGLHLTSSNLKPARGFTLVRSVSKALVAGALVGAEKSATHGGVSPDKKTLTFAGKSVRLVVRTGPHDDMLSYWIQGLRNPTLSLPAGTTLQLLYANTDDDMKHNLRFSTQRPPFSSQPDPRASVGTRDLAPMGKSASGEDLTLRIPTVKATYTYLCTIRGHALGGMFGNLVVR